MTEKVLDSFAYAIWACMDNPPSVTPIMDGRSAESLDLGDFGFGSGFGSDFGSFKRICDTGLPLAKFDMFTTLLKGFRSLCPLCDAV
eukprot:CAMPEP_0167746920 /NCGR_PEP_ID=MMETSP0110_2-20121227/3982_1 /TAXON_ID=629695 /ORGANISM="Gymnochlora sp., Strain CCMP2014" /LENGTH=86 /DNA_ID=CAMNT_0007631741 /DNA_START=189 /DNA_END=449 /DNA_ORIENTATION=+